MSQGKAMELGKRQRKILSTIQLDALMGNREAGEITGAGDKAVRRLREKLLGESLIYHVDRIQTPALGLHKRFLWCSLSDHGSVVESELLEWLKRSLNVSWIEIHSGHFQLFIDVHARDEQGLSEFLGSLNAKFGRVFDELVVLEPKSWVVFQKKLLLDPGDRPTNFRQVKSVPYAAYAENTLETRDLEILEMMTQLPGISSSMIAERIGVARRTVENRRARLQQKKVVLGACYVLNRRKLGLGAGMYLVQLDPAVPNIDRDMRRWCAEHPNVWAYASYDPLAQFHYGIAVEGADFWELRRIRADIIQRFRPTRIVDSICEEVARTLFDVAGYVRNLHSELLTPNREDDVLKLSSSKEF